METSSRDGSRGWRDARESRGDLGLMQAIRYAAVIANELMRCQEGLEDRVCPGDRGRSGSS